MDVFWNKNKMLDEHIEELAVNDKFDDDLLKKFENQIELRFKKWSFENPNVSREDAPWY